MVASFECKTNTGYQAQAFDFCPISIETKRDAGGRNVFWNLNSMALPELCKHTLEVRVVRPVLG